MSEANLKNEARMVMLEHFVCSLYANSFLQTPDPIAAAKAFAAEIKAAFKNITMPGYDPVVADMLSDELELAAEKLADQLLETVEGSLD